MSYYRGYRKDRWRIGDGEPPFKPGDWITPTQMYHGNHRWMPGEPRTVKSVDFVYSEYYVLRVWNPNMGKYSEYNPRNFRHATLAEINQFVNNPPGTANTTKENDMAYERIKYFALPVEMEDGMLVLSNFNAASVLYHDTQHQVRVEIANRIKEGDRWLVLQTVCLIEGEAPRPPIKITEYK